LLAQSCQAERLFELLTDFDFIAAKIAHPDLQSQDLIEDYDLAFEPQVSISGEKESTLKLIQGAIRLSAHVVDKDETQLAGQLLGRLLSFEAPEIQALLAHSKQKQKPWLRPFTPSLMPPGTPLLRTLSGHSGSVWAVAITPNGQQVVSASGDNTLKVWDLHSGAEQLILTGHSSSVQAVAITPDGQQVVSASDDNTLKVWDLHSGAERLTLTGHSSLVRAVAITPDGKQVVSASDDNTLKVWDLESGTEIARFIGEGGLYCCAVAPDGVTIVAGEASGRVHFLRLEGVARRG
jgi:WD40 repeat protein